MINPRFWSAISEIFNEKIGPNQYPLKFENSKDITGSSKFLTFLYGKYHISFRVMIIERNPFTLAIGIHANPDKLKKNDSNKALTLWENKFLEKISNYLLTEEKFIKFEKNETWWFIKRVWQKKNLDNFELDNELHYEVARWIRNKIDLVKPVIDEFITEICASLENIRKY